MMKKISFAVMSLNQVFIKTNGSNEKILTPSTPFSFFIPFTLHGQQRFYVNDDATGLNTGTYNVGTVSANGIGGIALPKVWPNPANDILYINGNALIAVSLYNATGRLVMEHNEGKSLLFILYMEVLSPAVYFLNMTAENQNIYRAKVVINR